MFHSIKKMVPQRVLNHWTSDFQNIMKLLNCYQNHTINKTKTHVKLLFTIFCILVTKAMINAQDIDLEGATGTFVPLPVY